MANQDLSVWLDRNDIKAKIFARLGKNSKAFKDALINICNNNSLFQKCEPQSILGAAMLAVSMNLSITPSFGLAYIVPYGTKAQFQIGYKGLVRLAMRTGQYVRLHICKVYEGQFRGIDIKGDIKEGEKISDKVVGYSAYMRLVNGFEKIEYMTVEEMQAHAEKYSQSYAYDKRSGQAKSIWSTDFDAMAKKTVLKRLLNSGVPLSVELQTVIQADQAAVSRDTFTYIDNPNRSSVDRNTIYSADSNPAPVVDDAPIDVTPEAIPSQNQNSLVTFAGKCANCGKDVTEKVATYSKNKFGKILCYDCQQQNN